nr:potassium channel AKT1-like [Tanacetum cinerariifolium]
MTLLNGSWVGGGRLGVGSGTGDNSPSRDIDTISRDERLSSVHSIRSGILPSLGAQSTRHVKLSRFTINPLNRRYRIWQGYLVVLVFYTAWVSPFEFGFLDSPARSLSITDNVVNGFFAIDIVLTFFVAYLDKVSYLLIDERRLIAWRYLKTWFIFDVISTIPSEIGRMMLPDSLQPYGYFNMLRLWRLRRVGDMFARLEKDRNYNYFWVRMAKLLFVSLFTVHLSACILYLIAHGYKDPSNTWLGLAPTDVYKDSLAKRYIRSVYWTTTTITTTGYGDIHAVNWKEMVFASCFMLFNMGLSAYFIGNMTTLIVERTGRTRKFRETIQAASGFAQRNHLPPRLQDQMLAHLCLKYRADSEWLQQQEIIDLLPKAIQSSISNFLFYGLVDQVYLFNGVSNDTLFQLVSEMRAEYFPPKEDVILQNEAPTDFYILVSGSVELISRRSGVEQVVRELKTGDVCGEIGVLCYRPQSNVADGTIVISNLLQHLKEKTDPIMEAVLVDTENMLSQGRMDVPLSLCFAVTRGDDVLLHKLLRRGGLDSNEMDSSGRTVLNLAAAKGSLECVLLLLDYGADPNKRDCEGNVPLWSAIMGRNDPVIKLLVDNGATLASGDVGDFASYAVEQNSIDLLKDIIKHGGDVTVRNTIGTTALHKAISEEKTQVVEFLIKNGANIDLPDVHGWTPRDLADHQAHEDILELFQNMPAPKEKPAGIKSKLDGASYIKKYQSEPRMRHLPTEMPRASSAGMQDSRRKADDFSNSVFGIVSSASRKQNAAKSRGVHPCTSGKSILAPLFIRNSTTCVFSSEMALCRAVVPIVFRTVTSPPCLIMSLNVHGWTPRDLADHQAHEDILELFQNMPAPKEKPAGIKSKLDGASYIKKYQSEPRMRHLPTEMPRASSAGMQDSRRKADDFSNSVFGIVSSASRKQNAVEMGFMPSPLPSLGVDRMHQIARVTISCPEVNDKAGKLIRLPDSLQSLLHIGEQKFSISPTKVLNKEGALIEDIQLIRDGDHLILAS